MSKLLLTLAILALFSMASAITISEESLPTLWGAWKVAHNKHYSSSEESHRFIVFQNNVAKIAKLNAEHPETKFGINQFADLTSAEFKQKYTSGLLVESQASDDQTPEPITEPLAASLDWRTKGAVTSVSNQGSCGACWAFSAVAALEGLNKIKSGTLIKFSPQQLMDCSSSYGNQGCNGGLMDYAFKYVAQKGIEKESDYPYKAVQTTCKYASSKALKFMTGYKDVTKNSYTQLKAALNKQPISVAVDATALQLYKSGIISSNCGTSLNHGVLLVGYGTSGSTDYWIVKNSWGASWGESGYVRIQMGSQNSGAGLCGINSGASYPI